MADSLGTQDNIDSMNDGLINADDARAIIRVMSHVADIQGDVTDKRLALMRGLSDTLHASVAIWACSRHDRTWGQRTLFWLHDMGWTGEEQRTKTLLSLSSPECDQILSRMRSDTDGRILAIRNELVSDAEWTSCPFYTMHRVPLGLDEWILSGWLLPDGVSSAIGFHRGVGLPPFTNRERAIAGLVIDESRDLFLAHTELPARNTPPILSMRARQVLTLVVSGDSPKAISQKMNVSVHTVNDHLKSIHRHFNVSSRSELLSKFRAVTK